MHHIYDHKHLIKSCKKYLKRMLIYVFEPTLREIHQLPEDLSIYALWNEAVIK